MPRKNNIHFDLLLLGTFLLIWATNAFVIFGTLGKYLSLFLGMLFLLKSIIVNKIQIRTLGLSIKAVLLFLLFVFIAKEQNQATLTPQILAFDIICLILFILGAVYRKSYLGEEKYNPKIVLLITVLIIISNIKLYFVQAALNLATREIIEGELNPVGVAYIQAQLFLLILWLLSKEKSTIIKLFLFGALLSTVTSIILTGSRGATIFMVCTWLYFYRDLYKSIFKIRTFLPILIVSITLMFTIKDIAFLDAKINAFNDRFSSVLDYVEGNGNDVSLEDRENIQSVFFGNYDQMIFGQNNYKPYPHNQFLEIYMRWGLFGIPLLIISLFSFIRAMIVVYNKNIDKNSISYLFISLFFFGYLQSMSSLSLEMNRLMWFGFGYFISDFRKN